MCIYILFDKYYIHKIYRINVMYIYIYNIYIYNIYNIYIYIYIYIAANLVQHKISFSIECIWEIVELNILKLTFILK